MELLMVWYWYCCEAIVVLLFMSATWVNSSVQVLLKQVLFCSCSHWWRVGNLLLSHNPNCRKHQIDLNSLWHSLLVFKTCSSLNTICACSSLMSWSTSDGMRTSESFCLPGRLKDFCQCWSSRRHIEPVYGLGKQERFPNVCNSGVLRSC